MNIHDKTDKQNMVSEALEGAGCASISVISEMLARILIFAWLIIGFYWRAHIA